MLFSPIQAHILYPVIVICLLYILTKKAGAIIIQRIAWQVFIATSALGTFVHEFSHALVAGLFGHKIIAFKPFVFDLRAGTLGLVQTMYSKKRGLHMIGVFCMSIAPLFIGTFLIYLLLKALVPNAPDVIAQTNYIAQQLGSFHLVALTKGLPAMGKLVVLLFDGGNLVSLMFWLFLPISFSISIHLVPSRQDFQNMIPGTIGIGVLILIVGSSHRFGWIDQSFLWFGKTLNAMLTLTLMFTAFYFVLTITAAAAVTIIRGWLKKT